MPNIDALPDLAPAVARHTLFILTEALPPPLGDLAEERAARDEAAIAAVAALHPADAYEARPAARSPPPLVRWIVSASPACRDRMLTDPVAVVPRPMR